MCFLGQPSMFPETLSIMFLMNIPRFCPFSKGRVSVGAVGAAAPTLFSVRLFYTHKNPLKPVKIQEFHRKLVELDFLHPQLSMSYATPTR